MTFNISAIGNIVLEQTGLFGSLISNKVYDHVLTLPIECLLGHGKIDTTKYCAMVKQTNVYNSHRKYNWTRRAE